MDNQAFLAFIADTKKRAKAFESENYVSEDVRKVLRDFLQIVESFNALKTDSVSTSADARILKKRYEQAKQELKTAEKRIELLKAAGLACIVPVKILGNDISPVSDAATVSRMKTAVQKVVDALIEISKI